MKILTILCTISLSIFVIVSISVLTNHTKIDTEWFKLVNGTSNEFLDFLEIFITVFCDIVFWLCVIVVLFFYMNDRKTSILLLIVLLIAILCGYLLKIIVMRDRPYVDIPDTKVVIIQNSGYGYPSGHSIRGFACATVLTIKRRYGFLAYILAVNVAYSRVYLGLHYPFDVIGGLFLGISIGGLTLMAEPYLPKLWDKLKLKYRKSGVVKD